MAFGNQTFSDLGGAVSDILGGEANAKSLQLKGDQFRLEATGTRLRAEGNRAEAENYDLAGALAGQNADFTELSTNIKQTQLQRQIYQGLGTTQSDVAGAGFAMSGSALDILAQGASEGALSKAVLGQQGLITEAGYKEQEQSFSNMSAASRYAASVQDQMADQQDVLAGKEDDLASDAERNGWITGGIKAAAGIATLFM